VKKAENEILFRIEDIQAITAPYATVRPWSGANITLNFVEGSTGAVLAAHSHPHEQFSVIETGRAQWKVDGFEPFEAGPGQMVYLPPHLEHEAEFVEDTVSYDVFSPVQQDLMKKAAEAGEQSS
jgi:quercetin dioxygenase-like cupin family protein